eukprot:Sdes_comp18902_c0_seq1m9347
MNFGNIGSRQICLFPFSTILSASKFPFEFSKKKSFHISSKISSATSVAFKFSNRNTSTLKTIQNPPKNNLHRELEFVVEHLSSPTIFDSLNGSITKKYAFSTLDSILIPKIVEAFPKFNHLFSFQEISELRENNEKKR